MISECYELQIMAFRLCNNPAVLIGLLFMKLVRRGWEILSRPYKSTFEMLRSGVVGQT